MRWLCLLSSHWSHWISRELGFLFLIYIIRAEHSHLIRQLAQASTDTQSYSCLCSIPQRQCCEDARYKEPYAWQRLNYHQEFIKERECTFFYYKTVKTKPICVFLAVLICMWNSPKLVKRRFSYTKWCSKAKAIQSELRIFPQFLPHIHCGIANASLKDFMLNLCLQT